jgi:hypothetical protein
MQRRVVQRHLLPEVLLLERYQVWEWRMICAHFEGNSLANCLLSQPAASSVSAHHGACP